MTTLSRETQRRRAEAEVSNKYESPKLEEMVRLSDIQDRIDAAVMVEREECAEAAEGCRAVYDPHTSGHKALTLAAEMIRARGKV
jgi:hypothetical protein